MSKRELLDAYMLGKIDRRAFIRGLVRLGVSAAIAASYATTLTPTAAASQATPASRNEEFYAG